MKKMLFYKCTRKRKFRSTSHFFRLPWSAHSGYCVTRVNNCSLVHVDFPYRESHRGGFFLRNAREKINVAGGLTISLECEQRALHSSHLCVEEVRRVSIYTRTYITYIHMETILQLPNKVFPHCYVRGLGSNFFCPLAGRTHRFFLL